MTDRFLKLKESLDKNKMPKPDLAKCTQCGFKGKFEEFDLATDGDWESGYYEILECPKCEDGGCVDDYDMSPERAEEWEKWFEETNNETT